MKAAFSFLSVLALFCSTVLAIDPSALLSSCGQDKKVLSSTTLTHNNKEIAVTTTFCPGFASLASNSTVSNVHRKRQIGVCNIGCTVECIEFGQTSAIDDCIDLSDALEDTAGSFDAPAQTVTTFTLGTCAASFLNFDIVEYAQCFADVGILNFDVANDCLDGTHVITIGGQCASPGTFENDWTVVSHASSITVT